MSRIDGIDGNTEQSSITSKWQVVRDYIDAIINKNQTKTDDALIRNILELFRKGLHEHASRSKSDAIKNFHVKTVTHGTTNPGTDKCAVVGNFSVGQVGTFFANANGG